MRYYKSYLKRRINPEVMEVICNHYNALYADLIRDRLTVRSGQTEEDLLQMTIIQVSQEATTVDEVVLIEKVRIKFLSLLKGYKIREPHRQEILTDNNRLEKHGEDNETKA